MNERKLEELAEKFERIIEKFSDSIDDLNNVASGNNNSIRQNTTNVQQNTNAVQQNTNTTQQNTTASTNNTTSTNNNTAATNTNTQSVKSNEQALKDMQYAMRNATSSVSDFFKTISDPTKTGFSQFAGSMEKAGEAFKEMAKNGDSLGGALRNIPKIGDKLGNLGDKVGGALSKYNKVIGVSVDLLTSVNSAILKQTDNLLSASDALSQMGAAGTFSTSKILEMANSAGITSKNLDLLIKPLRSLSGDIISLGKTSAEGAQVFANVLKENEKYIGSYRMLGFTQESFNETVADSIKLLTRQGVQISSSLKNEQLLAKTSREYADNLVMMSNLTGQTVEQMKKEQEQALSAYNTQVKLASLSAEENNLRRQLVNAQGDEKLAIERKLKSVANERSQMETALPILKQFLDPKQLKGLQEAYTTGQIISPDSAALNFLLQGQLIPLIEQLRTGNKEDIGTFLSQLGVGAQIQTERFGRVATYSQEAGESLGLGLQLTKQLSQLTGRPEEELRKAISDSIAKIQATTEGKGPVGQDNAQIMRNTIESLQRTLGVYQDTIIKEMNPFVNGIGIASGALIGLNAAIGAATIALNVLSGVALLKSIPRTPGAPVPPNIGNIPPLPPSSLPPGPTSPLPPSGPNLGQRLLRGAKIGGVGTLVGAGLDVASAAIGKDNAVGNVMDSASTVASMAGTGAMIGSFFPGAGTVIGGVAGGVAGAGYELYQKVLKDIMKDWFKQESSDEKKKQDEKDNRLLQDNTDATKALTKSVMKNTNELSDQDAFFKSLDNIKRPLLGAPSLTRQQREQGYTTSTPTTANVGSLLDMIGNVESRGNYNVLVGGKTANLTQTTIGDLLKFQSGMKGQGFESTAVGKYQITRNTLTDMLKSDPSIKLTDKFDEKMQDRIAKMLLQRRGLDDYLKGNISKDQFANNLSKEWAALPYGNNRSYYQGVGSNKALMDRSTLMKNIPDPSQLTGNSVSAQLIRSIDFGKISEVDPKLNEEIIKRRAELNRTLSKNVELSTNPRVNFQNQRKIDQQINEQITKEFFDRASKIGAASVSGTIDNKPITSPDALKALEQKMDNVEQKKPTTTTSPLSEVAPNDQFNVNDALMTAFTTFNDKLDEMNTKLATSNDILDKQLRYVRA